MLKASASGPLADTAALTIPVIEKYIANAGSIVGAAKNPTYIRLRDTIQQIVRSKKYLMNILKSITFYTIDNYIASFEESIDHLYRDLPVLDPEVQDGIDRILDPMVSEALHTFEMGNRLTLEPARLVALQNFATHSTLKETAAAVNLLPGLLAVYDATVTGQAPEDALRLLSGLQNQLSQTLIPGKLKKRFLSYLQKLKNNNNDQLRQKEVQAWRLEAEGFKPATEEQLEAFLDTAPNKELKRQYEKKLRQLMETGRKEKEKLREQEDKERRGRRGRRHPRGYRQRRRRRARSGGSGRGPLSRQDGGRCHPFGPRADAPGPAVPGHEISGGQHGSGGPLRGVRAGAGRASGKKTSSRGCPDGHRERVRGSDATRSH